MRDKIMRAREMGKLLRAGGQALPDEALANIGAEAFDAWRPGIQYMAGQVLAHAGVLFRVQQAVTAQLHQPPNAGGMLAVYAPVQMAANPGEVLPWVSGETGLAVGDRRGFGDKVWEVLQAPGANIWEPPSVPAIWKEV
jgi:hypothetical protein